MRNCLFACLITMVIGFAGFSGCSGDKEEVDAPPEKGAIKEMTDQTAHEMVDHMQRPINKARDVKGLVEGQNAETYKDQ